MQIKEFLNNVCMQIKYKPIRNEISEELENHIKESKENYMDEGMKEEEAEEKAIKQMGKAEEIGKTLNKIHKPKMDWQLLIIVLILFEFGFLLSYIDYTDKWKLNLITIIIGVIPCVLIYFFDYRKLKKHSNLIYGIATILLLFTMWNVRGFYSSGIPALYIAGKAITTTIIVLPLYIIAFVGFLENMNNKNRIEIKIFNRYNININLIKIILLSVLSVILLYEYPSVTLAFILTLIYLIIGTIKLIQLNKKKQIIILLGIPLLITILVILSMFNNDYSRFRFDRITASFMPEVDPSGAGWEGINQKLIIKSANLIGNADNMSSNIDMFNEGTSYPFIAILANYGWIVSITMILVILAFNIKLIIDSRKMKDKYGKLLIIGIASLFILRSTFCILMNLNLGIKSNFDIPFISYGKVNLIMDMMSLALVFSIYRRKDINIEVDNICYNNEIKN